MYDIVCFIAPQIKVHSFIFIHLRTEHNHEQCKIEHRIIEHRIKVVES